MNPILTIALLLAQNPPVKPEFEVASIRTSPPGTGFHFSADAASGGPGTPDPGTFVCNKCSLATLVVKAFNLQPYQFPARANYKETTYDIRAKIPVGASEDEFRAMLQNLLKDRFSLTWHFQEKMMKGYHLTVAKSGSKLKDSSGADQPHSAPAESHGHSGVIAFGTTASYRAANQSAADLARILSDQTGVPVDDQTGLSGKYDIALRWSAPSAPHAHADGEFSGRGGHEAGGAAPDPSGPTLFDALQQQLGLKLVPSTEASAHLIVIDRVAAHPTEN